MYFNGGVYAARRFYFIGKHNTSVSYQDNAKHLREELVRQSIAHHCLQKFDNVIKKNDIHSFGM